MDDRTNRMGGGVRGCCWLFAASFMTLALTWNFAPPVAHAEGEDGVVGYDEDRLPAGAVKRFGAPRYRDGADVRSIGYTRDGAHGEPARRRDWKNHRPLPRQRPLAHRRALARPQVPRRDAHSGEHPL
jgi:hypothetical protein